MQPLKGELNFTILKIHNTPITNKPTKLCMKKKIKAFFFARNYNYYKIEYLIMLSNWIFDTGESR